MTEKSSMGRRTFLKYAVTAIVCGVVAGVGGYYAGLLAVPPPVPPKTITTTTTVTAPTAPPTTVTTTVTAPPVTTTVTAPPKTVTTTTTVTAPPAPPKPPPGKTEVRIGVIGPLATLIGKAEKNAGILVAEELNAAGGVLGLPVKVVVGDTKLSPDAGVAELRRLVTVEKVDMLTGGFSSGVMMSLMEAMAELEVLFFADASSPRLARKVTEKYEKYKYWFHMQLNGYTFAWDMGDEIDMLRAHGVDVDKVYVIRDEHIWVDDVEEMLYPILEEKKVEVAKVVKVPRGYVDYEPLLLEAHDLGVKVVMPILAIAGTGDVLVKHWSGLKLPLLLVGHDLMPMDPGFWKKTGGLANYEVFVCSSGRSPAVPFTDIGKKFIESYEAKYGHGPEAEQALLVRDAMYIYKTIVEKAAAAGEKDPFDPDTLVRYAEMIRPENPLTLTVRFAWYPLGTMIQGKRWDHEPVWGDDFMRNWILQWQDGKQEIVWGKLKTADLKLPPWFK